MLVFFSKLSFLATRKQWHKISHGHPYKIRLVRKENKTKNDEIITNEALGDVSA
jgi:hypothetical protein